MTTESNWQTIWNRPKAMRRDLSTLQSLIFADGFDSLMGKADEENWLAYAQGVADMLGIRAGDSLFEIGCGSGAFLYPFYGRGHRVGGIDFSKSLLDIAASVMPEGRFFCGQATEIDDGVRADHFISNSVFFYFPDLSYAERVLAFMIEHADRGVAILDVPDLALREVCEERRMQAMPPGEYDKKYKATPHLYYDRQWFADQAAKYGLTARICSQTENFKNYGNAKFRFNVIIRKTAIDN